MLPVINLDDENFSDIFEEARKMISGVYPRWTDYNEHDPGITFLELFSWFKEMQQFHMNQIGRENYLMYLKLLGMKQQKKLPAQALVTFTGIARGFELPKRSKLYAGEICFETTDRENLEDMRILGCFSKCRSREAVVEEGSLNSGSRMKFFLFGEHPEKNDEFILKFDRPFEAGLVHSIYFELFEEYPVKRNPITDENFIPLAKLSLHYYGEGGWVPCELVKDETHELIQSGKLYFRPDAAMREAEGGCLLKIRLEECSYEVPPVLQEISLNVMKLVQTDTESEYEDYVIARQEEKAYKLLLDSYLARNGIQEVFIREEKGFRLFYDYRTEREEGRIVLYFDDLFENREESRVTLRVVNYRSGFGYRRSHEANGFPYQSIDLEDGDIFAGSLELLAEDELAPGHYIQWEKVENFSCSTAVDRHYVFDDVNGVIRFGDCENGKAPEGNVIIIGYATSLGVRGNVKAKQISLFADAPGEIRVSNKDNASKGCDRETMENCFKRFVREFRQVRRAITNEDYEQIIKSTPGLMIENVKAIPVSLRKKRDGSIEENCVTVVVQQYGAGRRDALNGAYLGNICRLLDKKRLVGTKIEILSPEYIGISVYVEVTVKPHYISAYETVKTAVENYFNKSGGEFGKPVLFSEIYGIIDVLDCVSQVQNLTVNSQGRGIVRSMNGDLILPANGLIYLKEARYTVSSAE
jgi:hypothetical protein